MSTDPGFGLLTIDQLSAILDRSPKWIRDKVKAGEMPHVKIGSSLRFTEQNLRDYIAANTRVAVASTGAASSWGRKTRRGR